MTFCENGHRRRQTMERTSALSGNRLKFLGPHVQVLNYSKDPIVLCSSNQCSVRKNRQTAGLLVAQVARQESASSMCGMQDMLLHLRCHETLAWAIIQLHDITPMLFQTSTGQTGPADIQEQSTLQSKQIKQGHLFLFNL